MPRFTKKEVADIQAAKDQAAKFGSRRLLFALIFMENGLERILAELEAIPPNLGDDDDAWTWFCSNVQADLTTLVEDQIDYVEYQGFAWEYTVDDDRVKMVMQPSRS